MKDINRRARKDSDSSAETPDFLFTYTDSDTLSAEISEWYTYTEEPEFVWNANAFKNILFKQHYGDKKWVELTPHEKKTHVMRLLDQTEISNKQTRDEVYRSILYLAQGNFQECETIEEYNSNLVDNVLLLCECDTFNIFIDVFLFEVNNVCSSFLIENKYAPCIGDNADLRVILSVLYTIIEVVRCYETEVNANRLVAKPGYNSKFANIKKHLTNDLNKPLAKTNELFSVYLFQMISKFCNQNIIVLPIKKIILTLWKVLLFTLGGIEDAFKIKNELRAQFNLPIISENPSVILNQMSPATPPPNPVDIVNELQFANPNSSYKRKKNGLTKQTRGIDSDDAFSNSTNGRVIQFGISSNSTSNENNTANTGENSTSAENNENETSYFNTDKSDDSIKNDNENENNENNESNESNDSGVTESDSVILNDKLENKNDMDVDNDANLEEEKEMKSEVISKDDLLRTQLLSNDNNETKESSTPFPELNTPYPEMGEQSTPYPRSGSPTRDTNNDSAEQAQPTAEQVKVLNAASDAAALKLHLYNQMKTLPWKPKVRMCELESFLDQERKKFLGYGDLMNDLDTLVGLPYPIHESVKILKQHLYISLAEEQVKLEEKFYKYPMSTKEMKKTDGDENQDEEDEPPAEMLFSSLLTNLPQYLICLLKILLTSVPQTRPKNDSLQIMSDLFPEDLSGSHFFTIKLGIDSNRHKELLIKGISGILLLMLKHFKVNHIYQFEFMGQHLLFANCVPLILKFFNLNVASFIQSKNNNVHLDFPNCVIGVQPELDAEELENGDSSVFRWRNVFSCINLLRILNKLTKYKRSRVMMLVIFKSAPILKKILRVKQAMLQYYALKLLKMQTRHLGRQWRKTNMSTMSAIYQKVRHRLNDDWAFGNEQEAQAWDFQSDECALRAKIDRFNQRRYKFNEDTSIVNDYLPLDNSVFSCLKKDVKLADDFASNYEEWLNEEVFSNEINWDALITTDEDSERKKCAVLF